MAHLEDAFVALFKVHKWDVRKVVLPWRQIITPPKVTQIDHVMVSLSLSYGVVYGHITMCPSCSWFLHTLTTSKAPDLISQVRKIEQWPPFLPVSHIGMLTQCECVCV